MLEDLQDIYTQHQVGINVGIFTGVLTGLLTAFIIYLIGRLMIFSKNFQFKKYASSYNVFKKYDSRKNSPVHKINIVVRGDKFVIRGYRVSDNSRITGEIQLDPNLPRYGTGYYRHDPGWGFLQIQIKSNSEILTHMPYSGENNSINQAFVWVKI